MKRTETFFDSLFETIGNVIISFIRRVAPFAVPAAPAYFFGHAVYTAVPDTGLAAPVGIVAALGLESAGILAAHFAVKFYGQGDNGRGHVAAASAGVYLLIGIVAIWFLDSVSNDAKAVGTAMFLIAGIVYLLTGLESDTRLKETKLTTSTQMEAERARLEQERQEREQETERQRKHEADMATLLFQQEMERERLERQQAEKQAEREHKAAMRRLELEAQIELAQAANHATQTGAHAAHNAKPATLYECACGKVYEKSQSYSAHTRFCKVHKRVLQNGQG